MSWTSVLPGIIAMAATTYLIRMVPLAFFRKKVTNPYIKSFLYFGPYAVLAAMTVPGVFTSAPSLGCAIVGTAAAVILAWKDKGLLIVSIGAAAASLLWLLMVG